MLATYDDLIFDPVLRAYFGPAGYYNAGYWQNGVGNQEEACNALVERLVRGVHAHPRRILDAGCGLGASTRAIARCRPGAIVAGINNSVGQLHAARGTRVFAGDAARLAIADRVADVVVSVEAAFHFRTREMFVAEAQRVLVRGGRLVASDILFQSDSWPGAWTVPSENDVADIDAYRAMLERQGFGDIVIEDATGLCWAPFCANLQKWIRGRTDIDAAQWSAMVDALRDRTVSRYVLVSATAA